MKKSLKAMRTILPFVLLLSMLLTACGGATTDTGNVAEGVEQVGNIGGSDRADQEYVWISNWASLPRSATSTS